MASRAGASPAPPPADAAEEEAVRAVAPDRAALELLRCAKKEREREFILCANSLSCVRGWKSRDGRFFFLHARCCMDAQWQEGRRRRKGKGC